ncbi:hypothetical protein [Curtobacterium sp. MCBD17_040]|uniref:hypothetical protein n=1 Tax=Curtobacterium sp. MCBD17_040 TaxID=2175674 RepID=UPI000DA7B5F2|nr:hypothetical protein [Curtobacterium sp. MCBD17_040]WIB64370.1 hypothetical protein DEI94_04015 [Curtobacterium sp. MCBD17_040]
MSSSPRKALTDALKPALPKGWRLYSANDVPDVLSGPTVVLNQTSIKNNPSAPVGQYLATFEVVLASALTDVIKAEDELDGNVLALASILNSLNPSLWDTADKGTFREAFAYTFSVSVITTKD